MKSAKTLGTLGILGPIDSRLVIRDAFFFVLFLLSIIFIKKKNKVGDRGIILKNAPKEISLESIGPSIPRVPRVLT
jgi:hypothetical protein